MKMKNQINAESITKAVYHTVKDSIRDFEDFNEVYDNIRKTVNAASKIGGENHEK